ncbi:uncharacterized protein BO72DRAFT_447364 [Aspergillus fijiensis CBS 313.89]|uniref:DUF3074 domain-containing protein n=1 Tax=Aspergillus fijiensis CBS 313.89 TaxID=1448319 RepID=A0A8G1VZ12_9EURO|nr:uncharacterized protein BO72DRAFT_447364 [Aspergillus fijiensis CBS 313.89]RAK78315.1 hypothetical protein BO72DRAFT_447364 [Aspergillus fijiensis CBS 313.89]
MADLQEALNCLSPTTWDSIPSNDPDALRAYLHDLSTKARLIIESVPEPPIDKEESPSSASHTNNNTTHLPPAAAILHPSNARASQLLTSPTSTTTITTTSPTSSSAAAAEPQQQQPLLPPPPPSIPNNPHHKEWSKPIKISSAKENPLHIPVYKLPGSDGKGHWFGRRSVFAGLPFTKWHAKLSGEMGHTLRMNQQQIQKGRPPDQAVRGIGAERLVEDIEVKSEDGARVIGRVQVYHVSAMFPKPTAARDFVSLIVSWEVVTEGFEGAGSMEGEGAGTKGKGKEARRWMMVSRPCEHPDVPPTQNYIRGQYESVEFIREIPVYDEEDGEGAGGETGKEVDGQEVQEVQRKLNPVEWVMVTRSDPGGNIPRWMVEKGTPKSICQDAIKFLNWACRDEGHKKHAHRKSGTAGHQHQHQHQHDPGAEASAEDDEDSVSEDSSESDYYSDTEVEHHGLIASFAYLVNAGLERYAPQAVLDYLPHGHSRQSSTVSTAQENSYPTDDKEDPQTEPTPPTTTTTTAKPTEPEFNDAASQGKASVAFSANSAFDSAVEAPPNVSAIEQMTLNKKGKLSSHEKQLAKLAERKRNVEAQLDRVRSEIQALHVETTPTSPPQTATAEGGGGSSSNNNKRDKASAAALAAAGDVGSEQLSSSPGSSVHRGVASSGGNNHHHNRHEAARAHKVASGLFNEESKLLKQLGKIEKDQVKEASKIEARQQKHAEKQEKSRARGEADALRREVELLKKEVDRLRSERKQWLDLIGSLQAENTRLAAQQDPGAANAAAAAGASTTKLNEEKK